MGNVPTKERQRSQTFSGTGNASTRAGRRSTLFSASLSLKPSAKAEEKLSAKENHARQLIIHYQESVDGGYLAPHGIYKLNLDFDPKIVRQLIIDRRLAPFYTPLQDFDASWTEEEILALLRQSPLHAVEAAYSEDDEEDVDDHRIHKALNLQRKRELRQRMQELSARLKEEKSRAEADYATAVRSSTPNRFIFSRDLLMRMYGDAAECPICFLFFPRNLNLSRCCRQPICSECFVQIKRLDPHPPHDESNADPSRAQTAPSELISESASCPYCAMSDFGVTYEPLPGLHVGLGSLVAPNEYRVSDIGAIAEEAVEMSDSGSPTPAMPALSPVSRKPRRRSSIAANSELVITTDYIRPDWEQKLLSARGRLARKAATASAIHASNLLIDEENTAVAPVAGLRNPPYLASLEDQMIEEAMRLSLLDENERKRRL